MSSSCVLQACKNDDSSKRKCRNCTFLRNVLAYQGNQASYKSVEVEGSYSKSRDQFRRVTLDTAENSCACPVQVDFLYVLLRLWCRSHHASLATEYHHETEPDKLKRFFASSTFHGLSSPCCDNSELQFRLFVDMASSEGLVGMKADDTSSAWLAQRSCSA